MIRSLAAITLLALGSLLSAGCAPGASGEGDTENASEDADALSVPFQVLNVSKSAAPSGLTILRKKSEYVAFFGQEPPAGVNFNQSWVIHYSMGIQNTGGYAASIVSIDRVGAPGNKRLAIVAGDTVPGPNCIVTMALTNPQITVKIPKQNKSIPIDQTFDLTITDCGTVQNWCASALCGPDTMCDEFQDACVEDLFCPRAKCANGYECSEEQDACIGRSCDPNDSNSCPSGFICDNNIVCITTPCPADFRCEPAPEVTCDEIGWVGVCQGPDLLYCNGDEMVELSCAPGQCAFDESNEYFDCVP